VLARFWKKVRRKGKVLRTLDDEERHELRIAGKKLRYAGEFFARLYADADRIAVRDSFLAAMEDLQENLGGLNDLVTEHALARELARRGIKLPRHDRKATNASRSRLVAASEQAYRQLADVGRFWRAR